jgi:adenylosuccinate synthase
VLTRYALSVAGSVDALFVTHLDLLERLKQWVYCTGYRGQFNVGDSFDVEIADGVMKNLNLPRMLPFSQREQFTQSLMHVTPLLASCDPEKKTVIQTIVSLLEKPIQMISNGPTADDVKIFQVDRNIL